MTLINNNEHGIGKKIIIDTERLNYRCVKYSKTVKYILRDLKVCLKSNYPGRAEDESSCRCPPFLMENEDFIPLKPKGRSINRALIAIA